LGRVEVDRKGSLLGGQFQCEKRRSRRGCVAQQNNLACACLQFGTAEGETFGNSLVQLGRVALDLRSHHAEDLCLLDLLYWLVRENGEQLVLRFFSRGRDGRIFISCHRFKSLGPQSLGECAICRSREAHRSPSPPLCAVVFTGLTAQQTISFLALMLSRCDARQLIA
jgi:hypothetical protein